MILSPAQRDKRITYAFWLIAALILIVINGFTRPLWPIYETRYVGVAWEMYIHHSFFLPLQDGLPYSQKPPLLFWLLQVGWMVFGVNDWWPRLLPGLIATGCLFLSYRLSLLFWPERKLGALIAPTILLGTFNWCGQTTVLMFDALVTLCCLLGYVGLAMASQRKRYGWLIVTAAIGLGLLAKGPITSLYILWPALLAPLWLKNKPMKWGQWYGYLSLSTIIGLAIAAAWAIPAAIIGGKHYADMIFFKQSSGRMQNEFLNISHFIWYVRALAFELVPWLVYFPLWFALIKLKKTPFDNGLRFCCVTLLVFFVIAFLVTMKHAHYILPLVPIVTLIIARTITDLKLIKLHRAQWAFAALFFIAGIVFIAFPLLSSQHYRWYLPWFGEFSPWWGGVFLLVGVFYLLWRPKRLVNQMMAITATTVIAFSVYSATLVHAQSAYMNVAPIAKKLAQLQAAGHPVAYVNEKNIVYSDRYAFAGRLRQNVALINRQQIQTWRNQHPNGWVMLREEVKKGRSGEIWFPLWESIHPAVVVFMPPHS